MKLTVGPLPPAVYWRRRVAVAGTLLLLLIALIYSCSDPSNVGQRNRTQTPKTGSSVSPSGSPSASASPSQPVFTPGGGIAVQTGDGGESQASASGSPSAAPEGPSGPASGPCTDGEIMVSATPAQASATRDTFVRFYLRIKNVSSRSCTRDVGADAQELYVQDAGKIKVWSSDTCDPRRGTDVRTFNPGDQADFFWDWDGKASNAGCAVRNPPAQGRYELVGRLATRLSEPAPLELK
jgi:hypothetical protein